MPSAKKFLATIHGLCVETEVLQGTTREALEFHGKEPEFVQRMIFQRIGSQLRFTQNRFP